MVARRAVWALAVLPALSCGGGGGDFAGVLITLELGSDVTADQVRLSASIDGTVKLEPRPFPDTAGGPLETGATVALTFSTDEADKTVVITGEALSAGAAVASSEVTTPPLRKGKTVEVTLSFGNVPKDQPTDAPVDQGKDMAGDPGRDTGMMDTGKDTGVDLPKDMMVDVPPMCSGGADPLAECDPVCQKGCGGGEECIVNCGGPMCVSNLGSKKIGETGCTGGSVDNCAAGLLCLDEGDCGHRCERICREDGDCPAGMKCGLGIVCDTDEIAIICYDLCNPVGASASTTCPNPGDGCYPTAPADSASASAPQPTECRCAGTVAIGDTCTYTLDCTPGSVCVDDGGGSGTCHRVCDLDDPVCPGSMTCDKLEGWDRYGACF